MIFFIFAVLAQIRPPGVVVSDLASSPNCTSRLELRNLGSAVTVVRLEARLDTGALLALEEQSSADLKLLAGERREFALPFSGAPAKAWVKLSGAHELVALSASVECGEGNRLRSISRPPVYPMRDPRFETDSADYAGAEILIVNTTSRPALAQACYSAGALFSVPHEHGPAPPLEPVCIAAQEIRIPPFSAARAAIQRGTSTHFALRTRGEALVLQLLRPSEGSSHLFTVDSSIRFQIPDQIVR